MKRCVIFDLDGCLADDSRRLPLLPKKPARNGDYDLYHADMVNDPVINKVKADIWLAKGFHIAFVTARPEKFRAATSLWLHQHFIWLSLAANYSLNMRQEGDYSSSVELKLAVVGRLKAQVEIVAAYDDRDDVVEAYRKAGLAAWKLDYDGIHDERPIKAARPNAVAGILREMAETYEERNALYGDNYKECTKILACLYPDGIPKEVAHSDTFGLFYMCIGKLTRFAKSGLTHKDSIHDLAVYAAMAESTTAKGE